MIFFSSHEAKGIRLRLASDRWALGSRSPRRLDLGPEAEKRPKWKQRLSWNDRRGYYRIRKATECSSVIPFMWRGRGGAKEEGTGEREQKRVEEDKVRRGERGGEKRIEGRKSKGIKKEEKEEGKEEREFGGGGTRK